MSNLQDFLGVSGGFVYEPGSSYPITIGLQTAISPTNIDAVKIIAFYFSPRADFNIDGLVFSSATAAVGGESYYGGVYSADGLTLLTEGVLTNAVIGLPNIIPLTSAALVGGSSYIVVVHQDGIARIEGAQADAASVGYISGMLPFDTDNISAGLGEGMMAFSKAHTIVGGVLPSTIDLTTGFTDELFMPFIAVRAGA